MVTASVLAPAFESLRQGVYSLMGSGTLNLRLKRAYEHISKFQDHYYPEKYRNDFKEIINDLTKKRNGYPKKDWCYWTTYRMRQDKCKTIAFKIFDLYNNIFHELEKVRELEKDICK